MEKDNERAKEEAQAQLDSIKEMVASLKCNYERLEELRAIDSEDLSEEDREELAELEEEAGDCEDREAAERRIQEDPLSVEVRSGWASSPAKMEAEEFRILLCTGGPACQIVGELGQYNEPETARLQYQDWFTPWEDLYLDSEDEEIVLEYVRQFYFGE